MLGEILLRRARSDIVEKANRSKHALAKQTDYSKASFNSKFHIREIWRDIYTDLNNQRFLRTT